MYCKRAANLYRSTPQRSAPVEGNLGNLRFHGNLIMTYCKGSAKSCCLGPHIAHADAATQHGGENTTGHRAHLLPSEKDIIMMARCPARIYQQKIGLARKK